MKKILNKKNLLMLLFILGFLIVCYFVDKTYLYFKYNISIEKENYNNIVESLKIKDTLTINTNTTYDEHIILNNVKLKNIFDDFTKIEDKNNIVKYTANDHPNVTFITRIDDTHLNLVLNDDNIKIKKNELKQFFNKNNITDDIKLFEFLSKAEYKSNTIFTSKENMKNNYIINYMISIAMTSGKSITGINGSYSGYIINLQNGKEVSIIKNDKRYIFTFIGNDYFTEEYIKDLLNTIIINEEQEKQDIPNKNFNIFIEEESNCNLKLNEYYKKDNRTIFTSCLNEINIINEENKQITLKYHLDNINQSFERSINQLVSDAKVDSVLKDGGTTIYKKDNYTIILCNTIAGNKDIYIGNKDFKYEQGYCK